MCSCETCASLLKSCVHWRWKLIIRGFIALPEKVCASHKIPCDNMGPGHTNACVHAHTCACLFFSLPVALLAISWLKWGNFFFFSPTMYSVTLLSFTVGADYMSVHIYMSSYAANIVCLCIHYKWTNVCGFLQGEKMHFNGARVLFQAVVWV